MPRILLLALPLLGGCRNACQQLCADMADYALNECGLDFSDDLKTCIQDHSGKNTDREAVQACADAAPYLEEEWTCDDLKEYFKADASSAE